jgi:hypothetical protein
MGRTAWSAVAKDEDKCRSCGSRWALHLHHAVPRVICPPAAKRDMRNGIVLCAVCHEKWHRGEIVLTRDIFTGAEWAYISTLELTGRDITGWLDKHYPAEQLAA